jgi:hypothetical protein
MPPRGPASPTPDLDARAVREAAWPAGPAAGGLPAHGRRLRVWPVAGVRTAPAAARRERRLADALSSPLALALLCGGALAAAYLLLAPPSADLQAAGYRANLFARTGFTLWDNGWYGGQNVLGYSLLSGALGALLGVRTLLALAAIAASGLFARIATRTLAAPAARAASLCFALGAFGEMLAGRVPYTLGLAAGLGALLSLLDGRLAPALVLAALSSLLSPVAGSFLALAGLALGIAQAWPRATLSAGSAPAFPAPLAAGGPRRGGLWVAAVALGAIALISIAFPNGGYEPFALSDVWPEVLATLAIAVGVPRRWRAVRLGAVIYALSLVAAFAIHTPMGSNASRLGALLAWPIVAAALWPRRRLLLALLAPALLYWQLAGTAGDLAKLVGDPSLSRSYFAPLERELARVTGGAPVRIEVPTLGSHAEAAFLPAGAANDGWATDIVLARGWDRQLDTRYAPLFYRSPLTAAAYRAWLYENGVAYVALPDARLDFSATAEGALIRRGLPFLREAWRSAHWRLFAVRGARPLVSPPARLTRLWADSVSLAVPRPGSYLVRVRYSPYWSLARGRGCVARAPGGWTRVRATRAGALALAIDFSPLRVLSSAPRCH